MISLSIVDRYHLQLQVELPQQTRRAEWKLHLLLPQVMVNDSGSSVSQRFYRNLLQSQRLQPINSPTTSDLKASCRQLRRGDELSSSEFRLILANLTNGLLQHCDQLEGDDLLALRALLFQFLRLQYRLKRAKTKKLYKLARQLVIFNYHQALLRERQSGRCSDVQKVRRFQKVVERYAKHTATKLGHSDDAGRERMIEKLNLCKRIIDRPYLIERRLQSDAKMAEQLIFGFAAALAMAFATGIAFATQRAFGNFTTPFFFSLVFSYIFKDRIKELGRNYLVQKYYARFFQHHYHLHQVDAKTQFADIKETFYQPKGKQFTQLLSRLKRSLASGETSRIDGAWVYHRQYYCRRNGLKPTKKFCDDLTLNLSQPLRLLPSMIQTIWQQEPSQLRKVDVHQVTPIYLMLETKNKDEIEHKLYRLHASRKGIHRIKQIELASN